MINNVLEQATDASSVHDLRIRISNSQKFMDYAQPSAEGFLQMLKQVQSRELEKISRIIAINSREVVKDQVSVSIPPGHPPPK